MSKKVVYVKNVNDMKNNKEFLNIRVKFEDFVRYVEKNNDTYLDKKNWYRIHYPSKSIILNTFEPINEVFEGTETNYTIQKKGNDYLLLFETKSNTGYRIDLIQDKEDIKLYHIGFSLSKNDHTNYDDLTKPDEQTEVFSRVIFIIKDYDVQIGSPEYCIGATRDPKKDRIYLYMMKFISGWEKRETDAYPLGWGIFFKLNN